MVQKLIKPYIFLSESIHFSLILIVKREIYKHDYFDVLLKSMFELSNSIN